MLLLGLLTIWLSAGSPTPSFDGAADANRSLTEQAREFYAKVASNPSSTAGQANPLLNPQGTRRGLGRVPASSLGKARGLIKRAKTGPEGSLTAPNGVRYTRDMFGSSWNDDTNVPLGHNGCRTRDDILRRDLVHPAPSGCVVRSGTLHDPYTGNRIAFTKGVRSSNAVQIDHVIPLAFAWRMGAWRWTATQRQRFANDPVNLLAVDGPTNESKSDSGPAEWTPPNDAEDCAYGVKVVQVADGYDLALREADKRILTVACGGSS